MSIHVRNDFDKDGRRHAAFELMIPSNRGIKNRVFVMVTTFRAHGSIHLRRGIQLPYGARIAGRRYQEK